VQEDAFLQLLEIVEHLVDHLVGGQDLVVTQGFLPLEVQVKLELILLLPEALQQRSAHQEEHFPLVLVDLNLILAILDALHGLQLL